VVLPVLHHNPPLVVPVAMVLLFSPMFHQEPAPDQHPAQAQHRHRLHLKARPLAFPQHRPKQPVAAHPLASALHRPSAQAIVQASVPLQALLLLLHKRLAKVQHLVLVLPWAEPDP